MHHFRSRILGFGAAVALSTLLATQAAANTDKTSNKNNTTKKKRDLSKGNTLYVVPYAHLDTQWRWAYPQVIREFIANTLQGNFALIDKYPNYVFNFSGSRRYEMMKEYYPADYERLKAYIKAGRWFPCGSSVDEADSNIPSSESLIRHVLYGNHFFQREFGVSSHEFMLPDCFGFPYALPSILTYCGIQGFSTQKLTWGSAVGIPFKVGTWEGPDGKSIVAALDPGSYGGGVDEDLSQNTSWLARIENTGQISGAYADYHYYGTGDRGGAPRAASVDWVEKSIAGKGPITVVSSKADEMFTDLTPEQIQKLPHYKGELLLTAHSAGSISSEGYMKRWNRKNEQLADAAEKASAAAMWLGGAIYPAQRLYNAWDLVLGSQMHDMLPGTSIPKAYEFCWNDELLAQNQFAAITQDAVGAVASALDTSAKGRALVVYNPLSTAREDVVEATLSGFGGRDAQVYGPGGKPVPTQMLSQDKDGLHIAFLAKVGPVGFATFDVRPVTQSPSQSQLKASGNTIENGRFKVTVNSDGDIASIFDKASNREILKAPARLDFQHENPVQYPAWNMDWADAKASPQGYVHGPAKISISENGPVRVALQVERESNGSRFIQNIRLSAGGAGDRVEVANKIDWQTKETALKASFPLTTGNPEATYDLQLGAIKRGNDNEKKYEVPQHMWFDLTKPDNSYGVAILNDCKYASDKPDDDTLRLTLIYTPGTRGGYEDQGTQDIGRHDITYAIAPHKGGWEAADIPWQAARLNQPLKAFETVSHPGSLGKTFSLLSVSTKQVQVQAIKKAEDSNELIVRLRELDGKIAEQVEIKAGSGIESAKEVNGQEQPIGQATVKSGVLITNVPAFSLKSFAIKLAQPKVKVEPTSSKAVDLQYDTDVASTNSNPADGAFDAKGQTLSAEQLPSTLNLSGITFHFGPTQDGKKNAVSATGQQIGLPQGYDRVYVLAASSDGDINAQFALGGKSYPTTVQDWGGYIGQWDNRLWIGDVGKNFTNYGEMGGLTPGYVKTDEVAWFCSHRHNAQTGNEFYDYSYLYKLGFDIPKGAASIQLPNEPRIKILAISVAKNGHDVLKPVQPLYDNLRDHLPQGSPSISPSFGTFNDATQVTINPPLYWQKGRLHYTVDGSNPTASSPEYDGPITINDATTLKAVELDANGNPGSISTASLTIHDTTPPKAISVSSISLLRLARIKFSERLDRESAEKTANYKLSADVNVTSAKLSPDLMTVDLVLDKPLPQNQTQSMIVSGIKDVSQAGNVMPAQALNITDHGAVFATQTFEPKKTTDLRPEGPPVKAHDTWTMNFFCKIDAQPENRTLIAGFGRARDGREGAGRYFAKFPRGINFWITNQDVQTTTPLDVGQWQMLTATFDGTTIRVYKNGEQIGERKVKLSDDQPAVHVMPLDAWERQRRFDGEVSDFTIWDQDLTPDAIKRLFAQGRK